MTKRKTVQVSFEASVTVELPFDECPRPEDAEAIAADFEGVEVDTPFPGRAWLAFVDADKAVRL